MDMNVSFIIQNPNIFQVELKEVCFKVYDFNNLEVGLLIYYDDDDDIYIKRHEKVTVPLLFLIHTTMREITAIDFDCKTPEAITRIRLNGNITIKWIQKEDKRYVYNLENEISCQQMMMSIKTI